MDIIVTAELRGESKYKVCQDRRNTTSLTILFWLTWRQLQSRKVSSSLMNSYLKTELSTRVSQIVTTAFKAA